MQMLKEKEWLPISVSYLFEKIVRGKISSASNEMKRDNGVPYVGATNRNNGVLDFLEPDKERIQERNCITFIRDGQGSVGSSIYRGTACMATVNTSSGYAKWLNEFTGLFVSTSSNQVRNKYGFGYKRKEERLLAERIMLPVTESGEPDYPYMAEYIRQKYNILSSKYCNYAEKAIRELGDYVTIPTLKEKTWGSFSIADIFDILPGKRLVASDTTPGNRPFIGALDNSNGIARFVCDKNASLDKNVLGVNYDGNGMVIGFYHPYECIFSDSVKRFHLKHYEDNAFVLLFMKVAILQQKSKFGYLYKFNAERMANTRIMLPVTDDGIPDYDYMEQYAKNLMLAKYRQYLAFLNTKNKS